MDFSHQYLLEVQDILSESSKFFFWKVMEIGIGLELWHLKMQAEFLTLSKKLSSLYESS